MFIAGMLASKGFCRDKAPTLLHIIPLSLLDG
jgi:hypothetical protein